MAGGQPYLAEGPKDLLDSCDILLKLDDGSELPAHSQILARFMSVFSGMCVAGGPLIKASAENVVSVPFSECSVEEATSFLSAIYAFRASEHLNKGSALSIARLSHKYGGEMFLKMCDDFLGETAGINTEPPEKVPAYLRDQEPDSFMDIMKCASLYDLPKLLACCEYNVALSAVDTLHSELRTLCASEPLLFCSLARIFEAFAVTIYRENGPTMKASCDVEPCPCHCCQLLRGSNAVCCNCTHAYSTKNTTRKLMPGPKEFLEMAAAADKPKKDSMSLAER